MESKKCDNKDVRKNKRQFFTPMVTNRCIIAINSQELLMIL